MKSQAITKLFDKLVQKRNELIKAQMAKDEEYAAIVRDEIDLLMDFIFRDNDGNLLYLD
ncbi:MAG: hypothetical protein ACFE9S_07505 [Candidatus Hermodarchaeota archaeon]